MKSILILGANGNLGQLLATSLPSAITTHHSPHSKHTHLDISNQAHLQSSLDHFKPQIIINTAAKTDLEFCQRHPKLAFRVNAHPLQTITNWCQKTNAYLIHISTANVFPGIKPGYTESAPLRSLNSYGRSKIMAEKYIRQSGCRHTIIRSGWMIASDLSSDKKFLGTVIKLAQTKPQLHIVDDKIGSLTCTDDIVIAINHLVQTPLLGTFHLGHYPGVSRYQLAKHLISMLGFKTKVIPVSSDFFQTSYPVPRPKHEVLISTHKQFNQLTGANTHWKPHLNAKINQLTNKL